jgi:hypothetical protein
MALGAAVQELVWLSFKTNRQMALPYNHRQTTTIFARRLRLKAAQPAVLMRC